MATKITRQILEAYLNCKTKAHLKLAGQQGIVSDYRGHARRNQQAVSRRPLSRRFSHGTPKPRWRGTSP